MKPWFMKAEMGISHDFSWFDHIWANSNCSKHGLRFGANQLLQVNISLASCGETLSLPEPSRMGDLKMLSEKITQSGFPETFAVLDNPMQSLQAAGGQRLQQCHSAAFCSRLLPRAARWHRCSSVPTDPQCKIGSAKCSNFKPQRVHLPRYWLMDLWLLSSYQSFDPSIYLIIYFIQRCNPWVACGLKIQERTIFSPKTGTEGTDTKKHWEAVLTTCASARIQTIQTDYKAKLHRFWHLLMQIAWPVSFSNFPNAADGHILLNTPDLFWPPKLSRREPAQYWPRELVGKCLGCCRLLMHGGTQTIRFWGLQHVHWGCEGSCCWFLRLQSRLVWDVPKALQGRQGMCGSLAGWFQVAIQAVDWFVPEHHLCIGLRCRFCEVLRSRRAGKIDDAISKRGKRENIWENWNTFNK